ARGARGLHIEHRFEGTVELDVPALEVELPSQDRQAPALHGETADRHGARRCSLQSQIAAKLSIEPAAAHEYPVCSGDLEVEPDAHGFASLPVGMRGFALAD